MARRPLIDEPMSRLAAWSWRLALFALVVAALSVLILRSGILEVTPALATFAAALVFAGVAVLLGLLSFIVIWRHGVTGLGRALFGLLLGSALLAYPSYLAMRAYKLPMISDVTTDPANPPRFVATARERPKDRLTYPPANAALQRKAYGDIVPLQVALPARSAFEVALAVIVKRKWPVADATPPAGARREGTIEATARSFLMGFRDDISIRVTPTGSGSRIDLRSASRYGASDLGANAARLRSLLEEIDEAASNAPEPKPEPEKPPEKKTVPKKIKR